MKSNFILILALFSYLISFSQSYDVTWTNIVNASANGNTLTKTGSNGYDSGASSSNILDANTDGSVQLTVTQLDKHRFIGLAQSDEGVSFRDIDYSIFLLSNKHVRVYEKTSYKGDFGTYQEGDELKIERVNSQIKFYKNGILFYTSTTPSTTSLIVDASFYHSAASLENVTASFPALNTSGGNSTTTSSSSGSLWTDENTHINYDSKVLIGSSATTIPGDYNLYVTKGIMTEEVKVALTSGQWSDFVFEKDYIRNSTEKVAEFIEENKHLPNVPSAEQIGEEGINLGKMDAILLRQIEELWLHVIELKRENKRLKQQNETNNNR